MSQVFGQLGLVFLVGFLLPIFPWFPIRLAFLIPLVATSVHPVAVALSAAVGASIGTIPLYAVSWRLRDTRTVERWRHQRWMQKLLKWLAGRMFVSIFLFALLPLPDQVMSLAGGLERYPVWRLALAFFLGRLPYFLALGFLGSTNREVIEGAWRHVLAAFGV